MESKTKLRWATLGVGVIGHQLADAPLAEALQLLSGKTIGAPKADGKGSVSVSVGRLKGKKTAAKKAVKTTATKKAVKTTVAPKHIGLVRLLNSCSRFYLYLCERDKK